MDSSGFPFFYKLDILESGVPESDYRGVPRAASQDIFGRAAQLRLEAKSEGDKDHGSQGRRREEEA